MLDSDRLNQALSAERETSRFPLGFFSLPGTTSGTYQYSTSSAISGMQRINPQVGSPKPCEVKTSSMLDGGSQVETSISNISDFPKLSSQSIQAGLNNTVG